MDSIDQTAPATPAARLPSQAENGHLVRPSDQKLIHSLVIDAGPIIKNDPPVSTLLAQAEELYTIPHVVSEIRDEQTRSRFETTLRPFLKLRNPRAESVKFVTDFARKTGDLEVLSRPDIHLLALTYELECERNGGDWRLRNTPTQQRVNGKPPGRADDETPVEAPSTDSKSSSELAAPEALDAAAAETPPEVQAPLEACVKALNLESDDARGAVEEVGPSNPTTEDEAKDGVKDEAKDEAEDEAGDEEDGSDDDSDGWITPSNLKKHQAKDGMAPPPQPIQKLLQAAVLTSDFAMQNVALRINLNLLSPSLARITHVKTWVLRCHGCFAVTRKMDKQFCPSCGQATLTRTSCSTDSAGAFRIHLKRGFQHNKRGNVYSVPKPVHGTSNGKHSGGGGQGGWGRELLLAEDQKEYVRKKTEEKRLRVQDLMDEDYLPRVLTGERNAGPGRIRVGAGRNVNSKRRH